MNFLSFNLLLLPKVSKSTGATEASQLDHLFHLLQSSSPGPDLTFFNAVPSTSLWQFFEGSASVALIANSPLRLPLFVILVLDTGTRAHKKRAEEEVKIF